MEELLQRALNLLDKGNIRYSDYHFEEERIKLAQDIQDFFASPHAAETVLQQDEPKKNDPPSPPPGECEKCGNIGAFTEDDRWWCPTCRKKPPKRVTLPVIK